LNSGLVLDPWKEVAKLLALMAKEVAENWEEYQKAYNESYETAKNNDY
jgi:hypothetical protein